MKSGVLLFIAGAAIAASLAGCSPDKEDDTLNAAALTLELQALANARILLGHQSVGRDILLGMESLAAEAGVPLRVLEINGAPPDSAPGVFHSAIGRNGDPNSKCEVFATLLNRPERLAYDVAAMKFCYVDLDEGTQLDPQQLVDRYAALVKQARAVQPNVRLVHITLPLRSDPLEWKTPLKRFLGRSTYEDSANKSRNAYNDLLRERFRGEPIFDLAALQSTRPDGSRSAFVDNGKTIYTLVAEYTYDGGHLNERGQRKIATEFVRTLANALAQK